MKARCLPAALHTVHDLWLKVTVCLVQCVHLNAGDQASHAREHGSDAGCLVDA
jgi:hypothetical protein